MVLEEFYEAGLVPVGMAELDGELPAVGKGEYELAKGDGVAVRGEGGRKLEEDGAEPAVEGLHRHKEVIEETVAAAQSALVSDGFGRFAGEAEMRRRLGKPVGDRVRRRGGVEGRVDLDCIENVGVPGKPVAVGEIRGIERAAPILKGPCATADVDMRVQ